MDKEWKTSKMKFNVMITEVEIPLFEMRYVIQTGTNPASSHAYLTTVLQQDYISMWEGIHPSAHENF